jgi:hypothetical protein
MMGVFQMDGGHPVNVGTRELCLTNAATTQDTRR